MNQLKWKKEHKIGLLIYMIIGASIAIILGYVLYCLPLLLSEPNTFLGKTASFGSWVEHFIDRGVYKWAIFGATLSFGLVTAKKLFSI